MFFSKSFIATAALCLSLSLQAHAHAAIAPALDVKGTPARNDVQRPSTAKPCGNAALTGIDTSTAVTAAANGSFAATITNFNAGVDGSRQVTATINADGTGKNFVNAEVLQNGDKNPTSTGSQQLVVQIPAGTTCSGGASKSKCLVSFTTAGGFGNCVVVDQAAGAATGAGNNAAGTGAAAGNSTATAAAGTGAANSTATDAAATSVATDTAAASSAAAASTTDAAATSTSTTTTTTGKKHHHHKGAAGAAGAKGAAGAAGAKGAQANNGTAAAQAGNGTAAAQANQVQTKAQKIKQFVDSQRKIKPVGTRAARIARRAAEGPAVEVLA
ncbi:hypothetical protein BD311DRAFT_240077 [Dichomitus squalens]|uniref:Uncharacterized protein n=1 Tax=Dichomitus squalens TaxID=114155 RepID=A0A4Q9MUJ7_9APHY|nr:hypothetical protein BD311DRAFT_240077 [Dichomitus squalens]